MKELKCKSCGGNLEIDEGNGIGICPYCKAKYQVNENHKVVFSMDDNTKEAIEQGYKNMQNTSKIFAIPFTVIAIIAFGIIVFAIINIAKAYNNSEKNLEMKSKSIQEEASDLIMAQQQKSITERNDFDKKTFNSRLEIYEGSIMGGNVKALLTSIVNSNNTNNRKVIVKYNEFESSNPEDIRELKQKINDFNNYEISLHYDADKYIYKAVIENI